MTALHAAGPFRGRRRRCGARAIPATPSKPYSANFQAQARQVGSHDAKPLEHRGAPQVPHNRGSTIRYPPNPVGNVAYRDDYRLDDETAGRYTMRFLDELQIAGHVAFLAHAQEGAHAVSAICVEERSNTIG